MEHKAFAFKYDKFIDELSGLLFESLDTGHIDGLKEFIEINRESLRDPYEGEPLDDGWENMIEARDAHQYGDFALTKYYDPLCDVGLGASWQGIHELVTGGVIANESPILGCPFGPHDNYFDPGKLGSYFQSPSQMKRNFDFLNVAGYPELINEMFRPSIESNKGLYITF